jgi:hypothetical protein
MWDSWHARPGIAAPSRLEAEDDHRCGGWPKTVNTCGGKLGSGGSGKTSRPDRADAHHVARSGRVGAYRDLQIANMVLRRVLAGGGAVPDTDQQNLQCADLCPPAAWVGARAQ